jgi:GNAT superfamily N-acetyltransferase
VDVRLATTDDIEALVQLRLAFATELDPGRAHPDTTVPRLRAYLRAHLLAQDLVGIVGWDDTAVAGGALLLVREEPPSLSRPTGWVAKLVNVYTWPAYRRQGLARRIVDTAIDQARALGLDRLDLESTRDALHVYEQAGFVAGDGIPMTLSFGQP